MFEQAARAIQGTINVFTYIDKKTATQLDPFSGKGQVEKRGSVHPSLGNPAPFGEYTFETFIANGKHKLAVTLTREITRKTIRAASGNPDKPGILVLCGPHGSGKTHLLRAVANELFRSLGDTLLYTPLSELEGLFSSDHPLVVRQNLASKQAILIDDFQYLPRIADPATFGGEGIPLQEELCMLADRCTEQGKVLIIAGVGRASEWNMYRGLQSRLEMGLWAELPEPDLDIRLRFVQQQARQKRLALPKEHMLLLAQHCTDIRRLSGVLLRVGALRALMGRELSEQDLLHLVRQSGDSTTLTPQLIVATVADHCGISVRDILGEKRKPAQVQARQVAMYLCRELLGHSYPVIGRLFGGRDHSTVMHGVKKIKLLQEQDRVMHTLVTELTKACLTRQE